MTMNVTLSLLPVSFRIRSRWDALTLQPSQSPGPVRAGAPRPRLKRSWGGFGAQETEQPQGQGQREQRGGPGTLSGRDQASETIRWGKEFLIKNYFPQERSRGPVRPPAVPATGPPLALLLLTPLTRRRQSPEGRRGPAPRYRRDRPAGTGQPAAGTAEDRTPLTSALPLPDMAARGAGLGGGRGPVTCGYGGREGSSESAAIPAAIATTLPAVTGAGGGGGQRGRRASPHPAAPSGEFGAGGATRQPRAGGGGNGGEERRDAPVPGAGSDGPWRDGPPLPAGGERGVLPRQPSLCRSGRERWWGPAPAACPLGGAVRSSGAVAALRGPGGVACPARALSAAAPGLAWPRSEPPPGRRDRLRYRAGLRRGR